jgi:hypothetical protein
MNLNRYQKNLRVVGDRVISYTTHVATIRGGDLVQHGWWSVTTQKHINYVARVYGLAICKDYGKEAASKSDSLLALSAKVAAMGDVFGRTEKEKNDWKKRMLAVVPGIIIPEDFDTLSEEERKRRLNNAIAIGRNV